jgi:hypothetical protein
MKPVYLIAAYFFVTVTMTSIGIARALRWQSRPFRNRRFLAALVTMTLVAVVGAVWEDIALNHFAGTRSTTGLIANPLPNTVNHEFTPRGRFYQKWAFEIPIFGTLAMLSVVAGVTIRRLYTWHGLPLATFGYACTAVGSFSLFTLRLYIDAINLFI